MTTIRYFVPADGDSEAHPNVFLCSSPASSPVTLGSIQRSFPIPGNFHYRFKTAFGKGHVWMDVVDPNQAAPSYKDAITMKLSRLRLGGEQPRQQARQPAEAATALLGNFDDIDVPASMAPPTAS